MFLSQWLTECLCQVSDLNNRIWIFLRWHKKAPLNSYKHFLPFRCKHYLINYPVWNKVLAKYTKKVNQLSSLQKTDNHQQQAEVTWKWRILSTTLHCELICSSTSTVQIVWDLLCFQQTMFYQASPTSPQVWPTSPAQFETCPIPKCILGCNLTSCKGTKTIRGSLRLSVGRRIGKRLCLCLFPRADIP